MFVNAKLNYLDKYAIKVCKNTDTSVNFCICMFKSPDICHQYGRHGVLLPYYNYHNMHNYTNATDV